MIFFYLNKYQQSQIMTGSDENNLHQILIIDDENKYNGDENYLFFDKVR